MNEWIVELALSLFSDLSVLRMNNNKQRKLKGNVIVQSAEHMQLTNFNIYLIIAPQTPNLTNTKLHFHANKYKNVNEYEWVWINKK